MVLPHQRSIVDLLHRGKEIVVMIRHTGEPQAALVAVSYPARSAWRETYELILGHLRLHDVVPIWNERNEVYGSIIYSSKASEKISRILAQYLTKQNACIQV